MGKCKAWIGGERVNICDVQSGLDVGQYAILAQPWPAWNYTATFSLRNTMPVVYTVLGVFFTKWSKCFHFTWIMFLCYLVTVRICVFAKILIIVIIIIKSGTQDTYNARKPQHETFYLFTTMIARFYQNEQFVAITDDKLVNIMFIC